MRSARGFTTARTASRSTPAPAMRIQTASSGASPATPRIFAIGPENPKQKAETPAIARLTALIVTCPCNYQ